MGVTGASRTLTAHITVARPPISIFPRQGEAVSEVPSPLVGEG